MVTSRVCLGDVLSSLCKPLTISIDDCASGGREPGDAMGERDHELAEYAGGQRPVDPAIPLGGRES
jgi:hypothetical protein